LGPVQSAKGNARNEKRTGSDRYNAQDYDPDHIKRPSRRRFAGMARRFEAGVVVAAAPDCLSRNAGTGPLRVISGDTVIQQKISGSAPKAGLLKATVAALRLAAGS